jgi:hypothetical protein
MSAEDEGYLNTASAQIVGYSFMGVIRMGSLMAAENSDMLLH